MLGKYCTSRFWWYLQRWHTFAAIMDILTTIVAWLLTVRLRREWQGRRLFGGFLIFH